MLEKHGSSLQALPSRADCPCPDFHVLWAGDFGSTENAWVIHSRMASPKLFKTDDRPLCIATIEAATVVHEIKWKEATYRWRRIARGPYHQNEPPTWTKATYRWRRIARAPNSKVLELPQHSQTNEPSESNLVEKIDFEKTIKMASSCFGSVVLTT